ncbi:MFS transporter (plasmid) [Streptomyces sp. R39]|uniref:MFS transporter n=1 Tax=Streptomyces sp. R39 TaxID=3238631 RepID=A0AB39R2A5_9ACTN
MAGTAAPAPSASESEDAGVFSRAYRSLSIGIFLVILFIALEATAVGTAMPVVARELDGVSMYAFAFSGYFTTSLFGMVLAGQWSDLRGPLGSLTTGIATFAVGLLLSGMAGSMWSFLLGRAVQGFGGGLAFVALYVVVGRAYPERLQPAVMATAAAGWAIPSVVGPLAAGAITEHIGWRWVFLSITVLLLFPLALVLPKTRRLASSTAEADGPGPLDLRRIRLALALSLGVGLLQYAAHVSSWFSVVPAVSGAALLVPAVLGLLPQGTYRAARGLPSVVLLRGVAAGSLIAAESFVPLMLVTQRGLSPTLAGLSLTAGGLTWTLGSWVQSRPSLEPYRERLMTACMVVVAVSILALPSVLIEAVPVWSVVVAWALVCFGTGLVTSSSSVLLLQLSAPEEAGANSAALAISDGLSNVILLAAGGAAFAALGGGAVTHSTTVASGSHPVAFAAVFLAMAGVALVGVWVTTRLKATPVVRGRCEI